MTFFFLQEHYRLHYPIQCQHVTSNGSVNYKTRYNIIIAWILRFTQKTHISEVKPDAMWEIQSGSCASFCVGQGTNLAHLYLNRVQDYMP